MEQSGSMQNPFGQEVFGPQASPRKKNRKRFLLLLAVLFLIAGAIAASTFFFGSKSEPVVQITPTPTEAVFPTDTPTPIPSPTSSEPATPTPRPTTNPVDSATGLNRSAISVAAQNGSGIVGAASKLADTLRSFGYTVGTVGNADNYNYENVTIKVKSASAKYLPLLKKDLTTVYTITSATADLSASSSADAVVIIGK